ncbi:MAG: SPOR domain-containing protein [Bacteroidales bacterium]|nr:SPOR domain-containing protein [Bacteroidales bacterium]
MDISKHIRGYLMEHPSVVVPELGRFTAVDKPSVIAGDVVLPPVRTLEFDNSDSDDDGKLATYIAGLEKITPDQARDAIKEFYADITKQLIFSKTISVDNFGILSLDAKGDIIFIPDSRLNIGNVNTYGLEQVNIQGETPKTEAPPSPTKEKEIPPVAEVPKTKEPEVPKTPDADVKKEEPTASAASGESIFATGNMRTRENTERRRPAIERQEPPAKPVQQKTVPPKTKPPVTQKKTTASSGNSFPVWIIFVLLAAAGLGVGFYYLYPKFTLDKTAKTAQLPPAIESPETTSGNSEIEQGMDDATDKKNALNPDPSTPSTAPSTPAAQPEKVSSTPSKSHAGTSIQGNVGQGKYLLIVGSFSTQVRAERYGKMLQDAGINFEIIDFGNQRVRVAVASYENITEAYNQLNYFRQQPHCKDVWVLRR